MDKSWESNNYIKKLRESEGVKGYLLDLMKLINGEFTISNQYRMAYSNIKGDYNLSYLQDHFKAHADEEWGHYEQLVDALRERSEESTMGVIESFKNAVPTNKEIESFDSEYLKQFFEDSEKEAIDAYDRYYRSIEDTDPSLADIIIGIMNDEREHFLDFNKMSK